MDNINVSRQSGSNGDQCIMEKMRSSPCTVTQTLVTLNKMSVGRGATFAEGWYLKLTNHDIPLDQKTFAKLDEDFH